MSTDATPAASSAADTPPALPDLATLSATERAEWRKTGTVPEPTLLDAPADSSPAEPVEQAASTDASVKPASEPGDPAKDKKGKGVESRKQELDADIQDLKEKLKLRAQLRDELANYDLSAKKDAKADPSPAAPTGPAFPEFAQWAELPGNTAKSYEDYLDDRADFRAYHRHQAQQQRQQQEAAELSMSERLTALKERTEAALASDPDFWEKVPAQLAQARPISLGGEFTTANLVAEFVSRSAVGPQILVHLGTHPDELSKLLAITDYAAIPVAIGRLEGKLESPEVSAPAVSPPKTVTGAPPPPPTLSTRAESPVDEATSALLAGDFTRYRALMNAKDVAAHR